MNAIDVKSAQNHSEIPGPQTMTHFHVYQNLDFISDQQFVKEQITIGRSQQADLFLDHQSVADIHALVNVKGAQVILTNRYPQNGLRLNGLPVRSASLKHEDVIVIGPFSLKIKMKGDQLQPAVSEDVSYSVRLVNRYNSQEAMDNAIVNLANLFHAEPEKVRPFITRNLFIVKKGLSGIDAAHLQNTLLRAGVVCDVQIEAKPPTSIGKKLPTAEASSKSLSDRADEIGPIRETVVENEPEPTPIDFFPLDEEEDEDGEIWVAPFSLNQILSKKPQPEDKKDAFVCLQVVKSMGDSIVDSVTLKKGQNYHVASDNAYICSVDNDLSSQSVTIPNTFNGVILDRSGVITADLNSFKTKTYQNRKDGSLYDIPMPDHGAIVVDSGGCQYRIDRVQSVASPHVAVVPATTYMQWQHWAFSFGFHFLMVLVISIAAYFQASTPEKQKLHFVKIDHSMLQPQVEVPKKKPEPKKEPPLKVQPQQKVKTVKPPPKPKPAKKVKPAIKTAKRSKPRKKVARAAQESKHPKAGGGFGEGNIKNRDINQTGLLSVLGGPSMTESSPAMAAVTNLDAVVVPGATEKNFSVGGLKGALGNGKISVATGQIVQTKGSSQVLRSAGARGTGDVAALKRGTTGKKKVQAMVTAKMNRTVKIEGGMSREMVKRVIDQHLDEITYCYETALMSNPSILGRMVFEWKIMKNGRVGEIRIVASSVNSNQIHGCIKAAIKSWQFPKPVGTEVVVSYPFVFDLVSF